MGNRITKICLFALLSAALLARILYLDTIPGLNGDEAWLPVQIREFLSGQSYSFVTPSQRFISPSYWILAALTQLIPLTNIWMIRLPTLLAGLATPFAFFFLFRRFLNFRALWTLTLLSAVLPVNLAFSRNMAEMSQVPLVGAFILGYIWQQRWFAATVAFLVSMTIYPTNIFLAPLLVFGFGYQNRTKINAKTILRYFPLAVLFIGAAIYFCSPPNGFYELWQTILLNFQSPAQLIEFAQGYFRLFSGAIVYLDFSGPLKPSTLMALDILSWVIILGILVGGTLVAIKNKNHFVLVNLVAFCLILALIYLLAQRNPFDVGYERYALFLVAPTLVLFTVLLEEILNRFEFLNRMGVWPAFILSLALLISYDSIYTQQFKESGGEAHSTYRTAKVDPKLQAFRWIEQDQIHRLKDSDALVVEDWWLFWTFRYFNSEKRFFKVYGIDPKIFEFGPSPLLVTEPEWLNMLGRGGYLVAFVDGDIFKRVNELKLQDVEQHLIYDLSNRPLISIWRRRI